MPVHTYCETPNPWEEESGTTVPRTNMSVQFLPIIVPPGENTGDEHEKASRVEGMTHAE